MGEIQKWSFLKAALVVTGVKGASWTRDLGQSEIYEIRICEYPSTEKINGVAMAISGSNRVEMKLTGDNED